MDLLQQGRYAFVITLHADDSAPYDGFLDTFGLDPNLTPGISSDYIATWDGEVLYQQTEARGVTYAGSVGGLDIYASCNSDQSSVQAGGLETSASNGGISLVVVDKTQARAVDSITLIPQGETLLVLR